MRVKSVVVRKYYDQQVTVGINRKIAYVSITIEGYISHNKTGFVVNDALLLEIDGERVLHFYTKSYQRGEFAKYYEIVSPLDRRYRHYLEWIVCHVISKFENRVLVLQGEDKKLSTSERTFYIDNAINQIAIEECFE